jgi:hypothetical protein
MTEDAFVESGSEEEPRASVKNLRLPINPDGTIDWDSASQKHKDAFVQAIKSDPNGILQNIQEEAGQAVSEDGDSGIADSTVVALANAIFIVEGVAFAVVGKRVVPVLANLHPFVAIKACTVTHEDMEPVMEPAKRIVARFTPAKWLQYQDFAVVGEHLLKLSAQKFQACVELAQRIEQMKNGQARKPNGGVVIDAEAA